MSVGEDEMGLNLDLMLPLNQTLLWLPCNVLQTIGNREVINETEGVDMSEGGHQPHSRNISMKHGDIMVVIYFKEITKFDNDQTDIFYCRNMLLKKNLKAQEIWRPNITWLIQ